MLIPRERNMRSDVQLPNHPLGLSLCATGYKEHEAANSLVQSRRDPCRERTAFGLNNRNTYGMLQEYHWEHSGNNLTILAINKIC